MPDHLESIMHVGGHYSLEGAIFPGPQTSFKGRYYSLEGAIFPGPKKSFTGGTIFTIHSNNTTVAFCSSTICRIMTV